MCLASRVQGLGGPPSNGGGFRRGGVLAFRLPDHIDHFPDKDHFSDSDYLRDILWVFWRRASGLEFNV